MRTEADLLPSYPVHYPLVWCGDCMVAFYDVDELAEHVKQTRGGHP